jgi:hypothetical protein
MLLMPFPVLYISLSQFLIMDHKKILSVVAFGGALICREAGFVFLMGELTEGVCPLLPFESPGYLPSAKTHAGTPIAAATLS